MVTLGQVATIGTILHGVVVDGEVIMRAPDIAHAARGALLGYRHEGLRCRPERRGWRFNGAA